MSSRDIVPITSEETRQLLDTIDDARKKAIDLYEDNTKNGPLEDLSNADSLNLFVTQLATILITACADYDFISAKKLSSLIIDRVDNEISIHSRNDANIVNRRLAAELMLRVKVLAPPTEAPKKTLPEDVNQLTAAFNSNYSRTVSN